REPSPPAHRVRHRSPGAAARSIQHYGAAQHGVHDHSSVPLLFGPGHENTPSLLTSGHAVEPPSPAPVADTNRPFDSRRGRVHPPNEPPHPHVPPFALLRAGRATRR